jgi:TRAP-type C4-dicarboxylate transport system permease small subunit
MIVRLVLRAGRVIQRVEEVLLSASILTIAGLTILNVICRSALGFSLAFTEEVSQFCIIVVCFVGLSYAASQGRHIRMTAVYDQLPRPLRKAFMIGITAATSAILLALSWYAAGYVATVRELGGISPALRVPFYMIYSVAPLGLFLAGLQYALAAARNLISSNIYVSYERKDMYEEPVAQEI